MLTTIEDNVEFKCTMQGSNMSFVLTNWIIILGYLKCKL